MAEENKFATENMQLSELATIIGEYVDVPVLLFLFEVIIYFQAYKIFSKKNIEITPKELLLPALIILGAHSIFNHFAMPLWLAIGIVLTGVVPFSYAVHKEWVYHFMKWLGVFAPTHRLKTAWDRRFVSLNEEYLVLVHLTDGDRIAGKMLSDLSYASSEPNERDIYIEEVYDIDESGQMLARPYVVGTLIKAEYIRNIDFISIKMVA